MAVKRLLAALWVPALLALLSGCAAAGTLLRAAWDEIQSGGIEGVGFQEDGSYVSCEGYLYNEAADAFFAALDARDAEGLRGQFAPRVQAEDADLQEQIEALFALYPGTTQENGRDGMQVHGAYRDHEGKERAVVDSTFPVVSEGEIFFCFLQLCYQDDFDADNVGLLEVDFFTKEEYCALGLDLGVDWPEDRGLNVCAGSPLEGEVRVIGGYPYLYEAQVPPLDEAEVQTFLQARGGDWAAFRERFGEPCAGGGRAFYDLPQEEGEPRWLSLLLDGDEILSARVVDDLHAAAVRTLWEAE